MKQFLVWGWAGLLSTLTVWAADPIFFNDQPINSPPDAIPNIDAIAWVNRAPFSVTTLNPNGLPLPFETQHTLFFTNSSPMFCNPGFRFLDIAGSSRNWMQAFTNNSTIATDSSTTFTNVLGTVFGAVFSSSFGFNSQASVLMVKATNIASTGTGTLRSGAQGLIHLEGKNINLKHNGLRTGSPPQTSAIFTGGFIGSSNYFNDFGVFDLWWGAGTNNNVDNKGVPMRIDNGANFPQFVIPTNGFINGPFSAQHQVIESFAGGTPFTNSIILPQFNFGNYGAAVWTNQTTPTNFIVQVVFYPTNTFDTNVTTQVSFMTGVGGPSIPVVAINSVDFDIVDQDFTSDSIYLTDALATVTNVFLARNSGANTSRPDTYEISRIAPFGFFNGGGGIVSGVPGNAVFDPSLFWRPGFQFTTVTNLYAAYNAQVSSVTTASGVAGDPTNFPGRIQIIGEQVDLDKTRIRAETALTIKATKNLTSNRVASVNSPWINLDLTSLAPQLVISNISPPTVRRFSGEVAAWSATWRNFDTNSSPTNEYFFHVLLVDPSIQTIVPVTVNEFAAHAANVEIDDVLTIGKSFLVEAQGLDVKGGVSFPSTGSWAATNMINLVNFTNEGNISIAKIANAGQDRPAPYNNYINRGTITAGTHFLRTANLDNSGSYIASGGLLLIDALSARMMGTPFSSFTNVTPTITLLNFIPPFVFVTNFVTNVVTIYGPRVQGNSDVQIWANDLVVSNSFIQAGLVNQGSLIFSVTNSLFDSGTNGINHWQGTLGVQMLTLPASSDLMGTYISSVASGFGQESFNIWPAQDLGASVYGYSNNLALGKLVLSGADGSLFHFASPAGQSGRAMYVDYLELDGFATNYNDALDISPDITIYFANSNVNPEKLDHSLSGRLRWVNTFTGPLSSTNIVYPPSPSFPNGSTNRFNIALVQSKDLDSDCDGVVNANDPTPLCVPDLPCPCDPNSNIIFISTTKSVPHQARISWHGLANSTYRVEYLTSAGSTNWQTLTNITSGPVNSALMANDPAPMASKRFYRVRLMPH